LLWGRPAWPGAVYGLGKSAWEKGGDPKGPLIVGRINNPHHAAGSVLAPLIRSGDGPHMSWCTAKSKGFRLICLIGSRQSATRNGFLETATCRRFSARHSRAGPDRDGNDPGGRC